MNRTKYLKGACLNCDGHLEFPAEMIGLSVTCPHCGQQTELLLAPPPEQSGVPRRTLLWTLTGIIVLGLGFGGALIALNRAQRWAQRQRQHAPAMMPVTETTNS